VPRVASLGWILILLSPALAASAQSKGEPQKFLKVAISGQPWAVQINQPGFVVEMEMPTPGHNYMTAHNNETGIKLSVNLFLPQSKGQTGAEVCRDWLSSERMRISSTSLGKATNLSSRDINGVPVFEYSFVGLGPKFQALRACMAKDEFSIELNLSKDNFKPSDEQLFTSILDATQIVTSEPASLPESSAPKPGTNDLAKSQAKASEPQPASPAPDLYRYSFSGDKYTNEFFNFSIVPPQGWEHANPDFLKKEDEKRHGQERDAVAKQTGRADLVNSGVLGVPLSYTLMEWRNSTGAGAPAEGYSVIIIEAVQQSLPDSPLMWGTKGSCSDVYYEEVGVSRGMKSLGKVMDVQFGGRTFAQEDVKFKENGKDHFLRILATCADKYYLAFHFAAYTPDEVKNLADVAKSIAFEGPAEK
jgi:hypothetical protein